jgi:hypothetical protein
VREFDRAAPGRRWLQRLGREARFRHWLYTRLGLRLTDAWIFWLIVAAVLILFFAFGFFLGYRSAGIHGSNADDTIGSMLSRPVQVFCQAFEC